MTPGIVESSYPLQPLQRISASRYALLRACELREIWSVSSFPRHLPRHPLAVLGVVAHQLLEEGGRGLIPEGLTVAQRWDQLAAAIDQEMSGSWIEAGIAPLQASAPFYEVVRTRTINRTVPFVSIARRRTGGGTFSKSGVGLEIWVESQDKAVGGRLDSARKVNGQLILSDFKSGDVLDQQSEAAELRVKESFAVQLKLYAALYQDTFHMWPAKLEVTPLSGPSFDVPFTVAECTALLDEARRLFTNLNARISAAPSAPELFASPSPNNCRFCSFRPACQLYQDVVRTNPESGRWPGDVFGEVWDMNLLRDGRMNLRIMSNHGNTRIVRSLSPSRHPALKAIQRGDHVGVFNVHSAAAGADLSEGPLTTIFKLQKH